MSNFLHQAPIILASGSSIRAKLLASLGLDFQAMPSNCDEDAVKAQHISDDKIQLGITLARLKAMEVSKRYPNHFVIAADQLCLINNTVLDKPITHETAMKHLQLLSGKAHQQIACLCMVKQSTLLWEYQESATVVLHTLNDSSIDNYLRLEQPLQSCGAYQFETLGKWLFKEVRGNEDTILGLPLVPLANALLDFGAVSY